jgi:hypothetical protein
MTTLDALCQNLIASGDLTVAGATQLGAALGGGQTLASQVAAAEFALQAEWHEDYCHCSLFPADCSTYPSNASNPGGWRRGAPDSFAVCAVAEVLVPLLLAAGVSADA